MLNDLSILLRWAIAHPDPTKVVRALTHAEKKEQSVVWVLVQKCRFLMIPCAAAAHRGKQNINY